MAEDKNKGRDQAARTRGAESSSSSTAAGIGIKNKSGSSAEGPYQILKGTWKEMEKIAGRPLDRQSPQDNDIAFQLYTKRSEKALEQNGIDITPGNTYALHVFGPTGGVDYLKRMKSNPNGLATDGMSSAIVNGNKAFFYGKDGKPRTNMDSYSALSARVGGASDPGAITNAKEQQRQEYVAQQQQAQAQAGQQQQIEQEQAAEQEVPEEITQQDPNALTKPMQQTSALSQSSNAAGIMFNGDNTNPGKFVLPEMPQAPEGVATSGDASMKAKTFSFGGSFMTEGPSDTIRPQRTPVLTAAQQAYMVKREAQKVKNAARLAPLEASRQQWVDSNPGKTMDDYWKWQKQRNRGDDAGLDGMIGIGQSENKGSCAPGVNKKKAAASSGMVNYAFGGEVDPVKGAKPTKVSKSAISSSVIGTTGLGSGQANNNMNFNTKQIVNYQPGVTNEAMGDGFYLYSKRQSDPGFNVDRDREFVKQAEMMAVQRTPEWSAYMKNEALKKAAPVNQGVVSFADGGEINNGALNDFNVGGSHEENPNGGIAQGIAPNGEVNTVEEGETKMGQYVFSDRLTLDKKDVENLYLPKETAGMTYAEASKFINEFLEENPFDIIIKRTVLSQLDSLKIGNDRSRKYKEQEQDIIEGTDMDPEKIMQKAMAVNQGQSQEEPSEPKQSAEVEAQAPQAGPAEQQFTFGGAMNEYAEGGSMWSGDGILSKKNAGANVTAGLGAASAGVQMGMEAFKKFDANNLDTRIGHASTGGAAVSGALKGATAGAALGPWGAAAGAVVGGALGLIGAGRQNRAANAQDMNISGDAYNSQYGAGARDSDETVIAAYGGKQRQLRWGDNPEDPIGPAENSNPGNTIPRYFMQDPYGELSRFSKQEKYMPGLMAKEAMRPMSVPGTVGFGQHRFKPNTPGALHSYTFGEKENKDVFDSSAASSRFLKNTADAEKSFKGASDRSQFASHGDEKLPFKMKGESALGYAGAVGALSNYINSRKEKPRTIKSEQLSKYSTPNYYDESIIENKMNQEMNNRQQESLVNSGGSAAAARAMSMAGSNEVNKLKSDSYFKMFEVNNGIRSADQAETQRIEDSNVVGRNNDYQSNLAEQDYVQGRKERARDNLFSSVNSIGQEQNDRNLIYNMSKGYRSDGTYDPEGNKDLLGRTMSFMGRNRRENGGLASLADMIGSQTEEQKHLEYIKRKYNG